LWECILTGKNKHQRNDRQRVNRNGGNQSVAKIVKQVLSSQDERKFNLSSFNSTVSTTLQIHDFTSIAQGTTAQTRIGATIQVKKLFMRWVAYIGDTTNLLRVSIFQWRPSDTVDLPQASEVYLTSGVLSPLLKMKPSRFKMISDFLISLDQYHPMKTGSLELDLNFNVQYDLGVDTGSSHLYLVVQSDSAGAPNPSLEFAAKVEYVDS
jgi:hypothetical protein